MAAWFTLRAEEDEAEDEANLWKYDSTWEGEEEDDEDEDGGGGEPEGAEEAEEQPGQGRARGCRHGQVRVGAGDGAEPAGRDGLRGTFQPFQPGPRSRSPFSSLPGPSLPVLPGSGTPSSVSEEAPRPRGILSTEGVLVLRRQIPLEEGGFTGMLSFHDSSTSIALL